MATGQLATQLPAFRHREHRGMPMGDVGQAQAIQQGKQIMFGGGHGGDVFLLGLFKRSNGDHRPRQPNGRYGAAAKGCFMACIGSAFA
jgi:hypothetical protein